MVTIRPNFRSRTRRAPTPAAPEADHAPAWVAGGAPARLRSDLVGLLGPGAVLDRAVDLVRYATDASPYRMIPHAIVRPADAGQVAALFRWARQTGHHLTFRAAGTSLNGQSQGEDVLVDLRPQFPGFRLEDGGSRVRARPGAVLGQVDRALARSGRRLGPQPASAHTCTIGGAIATDARAPGAGADETVAGTLRSATIVLPSGTTVDTAAPDADDLLADTEPELVDGLLSLRREIAADEDLAALIRARRSLGDVTGYRLEAFLTRTSPAAILLRLMIGSEGTLGFVAEAVLDTLPARPARSGAILLFPSVAEAAAGAAALGRRAEVGRASPEEERAGDPKRTEESAPPGDRGVRVELLDARTLRTAASNGRKPGGDPGAADLPDDAAGLLVELCAEDEAELVAREFAAARAVADRPLLRPVGASDFTRDPETLADWRRLREAPLAVAGARRSPGSTLVYGRARVPADRAAEAATEIRDLQAEYGFAPGVQGNPASGELHWWLPARPEDPDDRHRHDGFRGALAQVIAERYDGDWGVGQGTGRAMAPLLTDRWGDRAVATMWRVRQLLDPDRVLAPDVLLSRDPEVHRRGLHSVPPVADAVDGCFECGYCEPACPSRDLTTTPRQRIAIRREIARQPADAELRRVLLAQEEYDSVQTCAADGSCALACPVGIDTGALVRQLRHAGRSRSAEWLGLQAARRWRLAQRVARGAVRTGHRVGAPVMTRATGALRRVAGAEAVPAWLPEMPYAAARELPMAPHDGAVAVYFPACLNRIFGRSPGAAHPTEHRGTGVPEAMVTVARRAGVPVRIPERVSDLCCGSVWHSKGLRDGAAYMANKVVERLWRASERGRLPIVVDADACTLGLSRQTVAYLTPENRARHADLTIHDSVTWARERLLPRLSVPERLERAEVHPTCAARRLGVDTALLAVAAELADEVRVPDAAGCCGFAGDRGLKHPELPRAATAGESSLGRDPADEDGTTDRVPADAYLSSNRTCEVGLQHGTGHAYESFVLTLERLTRGVGTERPWLPRQRSAPAREPSRAARASGQDSSNT